jgi:hypothetical protein
MRTTCPAVALNENLVAGCKQTFRLFRPDLENPTVDDMAVP